jgi:CO dehydrogenase nickel-insertion accessory protein CooC1
MERRTAMADLAIGVLYSARPWRAALQRYVRDHVAGVTLRLVRDSRMLQEEEVHVVVLDDETTFLTPAFVAALRERGVKVAGVYDPAEAGPAGPALLARLGVDATVPSTLTSEDLFARLAELAPEAGVDDQFRDLVASLEMTSDDALGGPTTVAVGGPPGSGATEIAVALADIASRTRPTILADVDEVHPGIARRLGLALHPHLLTVLDAMRGVSMEQPATAGDPIGAGLAQPVVGSLHTRPAFDVIVGLANRKDWPLVRGDDVRLFLKALVARWPTVIVNLGAHLEDMSRWVDRFAASRAAGEVADVVVAVSDASPRGLLRFFDWLAELSEVAPDRRVVGVVNRAPRSKFRQVELVDQMRTNADRWLDSVFVVPDDPRVGRAAWDGVLVPRGRFVRAVERIAGDVLAAGAVPASNAPTYEAE